MTVNTSGYLNLVLGKDGLCGDCKQLLLTGSTAKWHPTKRRLRCANDCTKNALTPTAPKSNVQNPQIRASASHSKRCIDTSSNHLLDISENLGFRVLEQRKRPRSTMIFDQIIVGGNGVTLIERVSKHGNTETAVAGILRRAEFVSSALIQFKVEVRSILVVEGLERQTVSFGIDLTPACPGSLLGCRGGL